MDELERVKAAFAAMGGTCETDRAGRTSCRASRLGWLVKLTHQPWVDAEPWGCFMFMGGVGPAVAAKTSETADGALAWVADRMRERINLEVAGLDLVENLRRESAEPEGQAKAMTAWLGSLEVGNG